MSLLCREIKCNNQEVFIGYTHFDQVSGENGVATGVKGSEVSISTGNMVFCVTVQGTTGAYIPVPYDMKLVSANADIAAGATGTAFIVQIMANDTAGSALFGDASLASASTPGETIITMGTMSTATVSALSSMVVLATSATACSTTVTIVGTKVAN